MEPPPCIQNAMLTKDKKPFTYTPGGLNLSEIRSPRMARRIERNAAYEGVGTPPPQPQNRPQFDAASLPPSTLAAMQPQMHVQVFPSGPPPPPPMQRGAVPPPPPPPPPQQPKQPLPTQKIRTADQQIVERPDMTKIIPENPMALLKKTGGPKVKNTLLDEVYQNQQQVSPNVRSPPLSPQNHQESPKYRPEPQWSPKIIERPPQFDNKPQQKPANVGSIYIPPLNNQPKNVATPPTPQSPKVQSPSTPTLKEAPKPWQQKRAQPEEIPEWAKRESNASSPIVQEQQTPIEQSQRPRWPQNLPSPKAQQQQQQQPFKVQVQQQQPYKEQQQQTYREPQQQLYREPQQQPYREQQQVYREPQQQPYRDQQQVYREPQQQPYRDQQQVYREPQQQPYREPQQPYRIQQQPYKVQEQHIFRDQQPDPASHPNAVFVTQPLVLQHPGSGYGPPTVNRRENVNARIIPVQIEGTIEQPRNFNQQQNSFRKMQLNDHEQDLTSRFKQVPNDPGQSRPQVRNIPIQIEGGAAPPQASSYVPPSQQAPPEEPKKYTGSSIPSRSFKILQAMTAHDSCANAKDANENYDPSYSRWGYHHHPYQPPIYPYWPPFYPPPPPTPNPEHCHSDPELNKGRKTPKPPSDQNEIYYYPPYYANLEAPETFSRCSSTSELENIDWRKTPIPFWGYPPPPKKNSDSNRNTPTPYEEYAFPPYYMPYYYGYPPFYPYYTYPENDDVTGYSSNDEMTYYSKQILRKTPEIVVTPTPEPQNIETSSESDTDTEINAPKRTSSSGGLQTIKSVTDVRIYQESDDEDEDSEDSDTSIEDTEDIVPHQLSVIFEMSERTARENSVTSECTTLEVKSEDEDEDIQSSGMWNSFNLEEIASRIQSNIDARIELEGRNEEEEDYQRKIIEEVERMNDKLGDVSEKEENEKEIVYEENEKEYNETKENEDSTNSEEIITFNIKLRKVNEEISKEIVEEVKNLEQTETNSKESSDSEDWWGVIGKEEDDFPPRKPIIKEEIDVPHETQSIESESPLEIDEKTDTNQSCVQSVEIQNEETKVPNQNCVQEEETIQETLPTIKDRIKALQEDILAKKKKLGDEKALKDCIRSQIINERKTEEILTEKLEPFSTHSSSSASSRKVSNVDSAPEQETSSEDSDSSDEEEKQDLNNNDKMPTIKERIQALQQKTSAKSSVKSFDEISEEDSGVTDMSEEFPELRKMSKYQRASTHSRLFQLLQEESEIDDEIDINDRKSQLTLPLTNTDKLADELVTSMLKQKKGQIFRNMSMEKLHAAAKKILQEDQDTPSEGFSEFLSPLTENSTPQDYNNYNEYAQYYETWAQIPCKLSLARCPRVLSSKNVNSDLMKVDEESSLSRNS